MSQASWGRPRQRSIRDRKQSRITSILPPNLINRTAYRAKSTSKAAQGTGTMSVYHMYIRVFYAKRPLSSRLLRSRYGGAKLESLSILPQKTMVSSNSTYSGYTVAGSQYIGAQSLTKIFQTVRTRRPTTCWNSISLEAGCWIQPSRTLSSELLWTA